MCVCVLGVICVLLLAVCCQPLIASEISGYLPLSGYLNCQLKCHLQTPEMNVEIAETRESMLRSSFSQDCFH